MRPPATLGRAAEGSEPSWELYSRFPVVMYGCESWTIKKAECQRMGAFKLWCWRKLLSIPWTTRRSNQSILKEINPEYSLDGLMLKLQYFGSDAKSWLIGKDPDTGKDWGQEKKGTTEDETVGWHHELSGHEFEQTLGDGEGQGSLVCCSLWGRKELDTTEQLNSKNNIRGTTDCNHPPWVGKTVTSCMSYLTTGGPGKESRTNKLPPKGSVQEKSKGERRCQSMCPSRTHLAGILLGWVMPLPPWRTWSQSDWPETTQN